MKIGRTKTKADTTGIHVWLILWKAFRSVEVHVIRHIATLDMCMSDFGVLEALLHKGPMTVKEIGAKVLLTSGSMTAAIDRLERRGLVERKEDEADRRARVIRLTAAGRSIIRKAFEQHKQAMEQVVAGVEVADRKRLIDLLKNLGLQAERRLAPEPKESVAVKNGRQGSEEE